MLDYILYFTNDSFFPQHAGELRIIILRRNRWPNIGPYMLPDWRLLKSGLLEI
jgi:hypothetical protein